MRRHRSIWLIHAHGKRQACHKDDEDAKAQHGMENADVACGISGYHRQKRVRQIAGYVEGRDQAGTFFGPCPRHKTAQDAKEASAKAIVST